MSVKRNVIANYFGQGWRAALSLLLLPVYLQLLGLEAFGLIGVFTMLQNWLILVEAGIRPTLIREMARFDAGSLEATQVNNLLRTFEIIALGLIALLVTLSILTAPWLADHWLNASTLPSGEIAQALAIMGIVAAIKILEGIYSSCLAGLQRQVLDNALSTVFATLRGFGALAILYFWSPTIFAFFVWQGLVSVLSVISYMVAVYRLLPTPDAPRRFSRTAFRNVRAFAGGMATITFQSVILSQTDKIILAKILPLKEFAMYSLANALANGLTLLTGPLTGAYYPRFTALRAMDRERQLIHVFHQASQFITVFVGAAAFTLICNAQKVLLVWTSDPSLAYDVSALLMILALGTFLHSLVWVPYHVQLAYGWTSLTIKVNAVAMIVLIPAIILLVPKFGFYAAAWIWVILNAFYLLFYINFMHRKILIGEKSAWYIRDIMIPLLPIIAIGLLVHYVDLGGRSKVVNTATISLCGMAMLLGSLLVTTDLRQAILRIVKGEWDKLHARYMN